jgi:hypothetical protein
VDSERVEPPDGVVRVGEGVTCAVVPGAAMPGVTLGATGSLAAGVVAIFGGRGGATGGGGRTGAGGAGTAGGACATGVPSAGTEAIASRLASELSAA